MLTLKEKEIRYNKVRQSMAKRGLDALIVICDAQIEKKGLLKYLTNYRSMLYNPTLIFPYEGEPRLSTPSAVQKYWASKQSWIKNVEQQNPTLEETIVRQIKEMGLEKAKFGIASMKIMNAATYNYLVEHLPEASFVEAADVIDENRKNKCPIEQEMIRQVAALADESFALISRVLKPGMTEQQLLAEVDTMLLTSGAQDVFHLICSKPGDLFPFVATDREIQMGDSVIINNELSGVGGYWIQMVRTAFVGPCSGNAEKMYDTLVNLVNQLPEKLVPGAKTAEISQWLLEQTNAAGYEVGVHFGHCLGLDVVEKPIISIMDKDALEAGMVLTVHPQFVTTDKTETVWYADAYLVKEDGPAEVLTKFDPELLKLKF